MQGRVFALRGSIGQILHPAGSLFGGVVVVLAAVIVRSRLRAELATAAPAGHDDRDCAAVVA